MTIGEVSEPFRPRARMLQLLGDELIGSPRLAVFELVKNAYDADANEAVIRLDLTAQGEADAGVDQPDLPGLDVAPRGEPAITMTDDGDGMTLETLRSVWLVPGDDHRRRQRAESRRSPRHNRLPLGEKGLGRFAVHKLGNRIRLTTRARDADECVVEIDWNELIEKPFLDEAPVRIRVRQPEIFTGDATGTRIEVRELRQPAWSRSEVRRLHNQITSICSPFEEPGRFRATLEVPGNEHWIEDLPDFAALIDRALWKFSFRLDDGRFDFRYEFREVPGFKLDGRIVEKNGGSMKLPPISGDGRTERKVVADAATTRGIGPVSGEFHVFDRDREVLQRLGDTRLLTSYLDEYGGVRVYRDGIRVYNYGEEGDDWLGLDLRRVNIPTRRISRNIILGAIHLSLQSSSDLVEKTNREGFVENDACRRLRVIVLWALGALEEERQIDKERLRQLAASPSDPTASRIEKPIAELRSALDREGHAETFEPYVARIERDYVSMQETLLAAGMSGLNLAVVFHEVERGVRTLHQVIVEGKDLAGAARQAQELMRLLGGFSTLLRRDSKRMHSARKLVAAARRFNLLRLRHHRIRLVCPLLDGGAGFESSFSFGLVLGALNNLIDNALYWLRVRWPEVAEDGGTSERRLFVGTWRDFKGGPAIVVADNGAGFADDVPERLVRPFFTRKPDGMGLGLYYANLAMELNGGRLAFPQPGEVDLPDGFGGAVVAMIFKAGT